MRFLLIPASLVVAGCFGIQVFMCAAVTLTAVVGYKIYKVYKQVMFAKQVHEILRPVDITDVLPVDTVREVSWQYGARNPDGSPIARIHLYDGKRG